jgi:Protein of unknown function (DUF3006)
MREMVYTVDRLEGEIAVLVGDDGAALDVLAADLPLEVGPGSVLRVPLTATGLPDWSSAVVDDAERARRLQRARERLEPLRRTDPGSDVVL